MSEEENEYSALMGEDEKSEKKSQAMGALLSAYKATKAKEEKTLIWAVLVDKNGEKKLKLLFVGCLMALPSGKNRYMLDGFVIDGEAKSYREIYAAYNDSLSSDANDKMYLLKAYEIVDWNSERQKLYNRSYACKSCKGLFASELKIAKKSWPDLFKLLDKED